MRSFSACVVALASATACGDTAAVVTVRGDLAVPAEVDGLCLAISDRAAGGGEFARFYLLGDAIPELPQSLTVEPGSASTGEARARGYLGGVEVARDLARFDFSGVVDVDLDLDRCPGGDRGEPRIAGTADTPADVRVAASYGRGGTILVAAGAGFVAAYRADGGLSGASVTLPDAPASSPLELVAFDADADCDDDLLVLLPDAPPLLWRRDGRDFAQVDTAFEGAGLAAEQAAAAADVDRDGDLDLVFGRGSVLRLLRNDGAGRFQPDGAAIPSGVAADVTALAFGDVDLDGQVDLVVGQGSADPAPNLVLLNDPGGTGSFELARAALPELPLRTRALALADANGDGAVDLAVGAVGSPVRLYVNRGDGRLEDRSFVTLPTTDPADVATLVAGDWDGDCLVDLAIGTNPDAAPISWRGSDTGAFVTEPFTEGAGDRVLLVDIDDDGDRDLVVSGGGGTTWVRR